MKNSTKNNIKETILREQFEKFHPYLSWSRIWLFRRSKEEYRQKYFYGKETIETEPMRLGKTFALCLEKGELSGENVIDFALEFVPKYPEREVPIEVHCGTCLLKGVMDGYDREINEGGEYKTGQQKWTQKKADTWGQITLYSYMIYLQTKKIPTFKLIWYDTKNKQVEIFKTQRTTRDLLVFQMNDIKKTWDGIYEMWKEEFKDIV